MLTVEKVKQMGACLDSIVWGNEIWKDKSFSEKEVFERLIKEERFNWGNWLICRLLSVDNRVRYAIFAAKCVLKIYEKKYPKDNRPRKAIEAAETYLKLKTKDAADAAAYAADAAAYAADVAAYAAHAAYAAADAADVAAYAAAYAAYAAAYAADAAADAAYAAAHATKEKLQIKILKYGMKLLAKEPQNA